MKARWHMCVTTDFGSPYLKTHIDDSRSLIIKPMVSLNGERFRVYLIKEPAYELLATFDLFSDAFKHGDELYDSLKNTEA